jgi:hypothetical protein
VDVFGAFLIHHGKYEEQILQLKGKFEYVSLDVSVRTLPVYGHVDERAGVGRITYKMGFEK